MRRRVKEAVEIAGLVQYADIHPFGRLPTHKGQKPCGVTFKDTAVILDPFQNCCGNRKDDPGRIEATRAQDMVDKVTVNPPVPVLEGVHIDKAEGKVRSRNHGIDPARVVAVKIDKALDQAWQIIGVRTDMIGKRHAGIAIMLANEAAFIPKAKRYEAFFAYHDALESQEFVQVEGVLPGLSDGLSPTLNPVLRRSLTFNGVARFRVFQK